MFIFTINKKFNPFNKEILNKFREMCRRISLIINYDLRFTIWKEFINYKIDYNNTFDPG